MKPALIALAALALAPTAQAQASDTCITYRKIIAAAPGGFPALRGQRSTGDVFAATLAPPGFAACSIMEGPDRVMLACHRLVASEAAAQAAYDAAVAEARACLAGWEEGAPDNADNQQFQMTSAIELRGQGAEAGIELGLSAFREKAGPTTVHRFAVVFLWRRPAAS